jgi:hypothetical protein
MEQIHEIQRAVSNDGHVQVSMITDISDILDAALEWVKPAQGEAWSAEIQKRVNAIATMQQVLGTEVSYEDIISAQALMANDSLQWLECGAVWNTKASHRVKLTDIVRSAADATTEGVPEAEKRTVSAAAIDKAYIALQDEMTWLAKSEVETGWLTTLESRRNCLNSIRQAINSTKTSAQDIAAAYNTVTNVTTVWLDEVEVIQWTEILEERLQSSNSIRGLADAERLSVEQMSAIEKSCAETHLWLEEEVEWKSLIMRRLQEMQKFQTAALGSSVPSRLVIQAYDEIGSAVDW